MQSIETSEGAASLTGRQITNRKGQFRVWISHLAPPQGEDWLNTGGETEGLVAIRYLLAEAAVAPSARVQKLDDN
jgi:type II secretory pathway component PulM